ncbi:hypothetical protein GXN76_13695 [Kroppenstedtia pulmonis]|uniref:Uncharacterized protein n=1 Tax=Kroppenstedtia pulmonis TaxID=1380685 RepID=A0A7D4BGW3_9BACL|nr:hypothetical protein [Kroppenstedtia pulmonis]QKG85412.1 hypothetical protein GXN76_13695 [Kroppenstedtia pulmonis]
MKISLAEGIIIRNLISKRIQELISERDQVAFVTVPKGEEYDRPDRKVEDVTLDLEKTHAQYMKLDMLIHEANIRHSIKWKDNEYSIVAAIDLAKRLRGELYSMKHFAKSQKQKYASSYGSDTMMVTYAQFEPSDYRKKAEKLERQVNRLSSLIEAKNHEVELEFVEAKYYMES